MSKPKANRGRSATGLSSTQKAASRVEVDQTREEQLEPSRPARIPMVAGYKLAYSHLDPNYHHCWVQDSGSKISQHRQAYYEFVKEDGKNVERASGAFPLYLMRLKNEYWQEDQDLKHQRTVATLQKEQSLEAGDYIPGEKEGRTHVLEKDNYDPLA